MILSFQCRAEDAMMIAGDFNSFVQSMGRELGG
jgi:hypothetical protein